MDGRNCYDIDECDINSWETAHGCHPDARCVNTAGSYQCKCLEGFTGNGMATGGTGVTITIDGMNNQDGCRDIDECNTLKPCGANSHCTNSPGSFKCDCKPGFEGDAIDGCTDIDECQDTSPCRFGYKFIVRLSILIVATSYK